MFVGRVFVTKGFDRWSKNRNVEDSHLLETIDLAEKGIVASQGHLGNQAGRPL